MVNLKDLTGGHVYGSYTGLQNRKEQFMKHRHYQGLLLGEERGGGFGSSSPHTYPSTIIAQIMPLCLF